MNTICRRGACRVGPAYVHAYECVWCGDVGNGSRSRGSEGPGVVLVVERVESEWNSRWGTLSGRVGVRVGRVYGLTFVGDYSSRFLLV